MISLDQPVSDGVVAVQPVPLNKPTLACSTSGEKVNESPKGLKMTVGRKLGARPRPMVTAPKSPDRPRLASREKKLSPVKRPGVPELMRMNEVSAKLALRPPPRSSVPLKPTHEVVMPPLPTCLVEAESPAMRMEPAKPSIRPMT